MQPQGTRKYPRFRLRQPAQVAVQGASGLSAIPTVTENISRGGVLVAAASSIPLGAKVLMVLSLQAEATAQPIKIACEGRIVRIEPRAPTGAFAMAVEFAEPLSSFSTEVN